MKPRRLHLERLEHRQLLAAASGVWHNASMPPDVDSSGDIAPVDALVVIGALNRRGGAIAPLPSEAPDGSPMLDVNDDGNATPLDALIVLNRLAPEGEDDGGGSGSTDDPAIDPEFFAAINSSESLGPQNLLTPDDVKTLLDRAVVAHPSNDAIIAIVDRGGRILGVRVESDVNSNVRDNPDTFAFAIDGAVAKARTAAFFSSNAAPLPSRTVRFISQSTNTQREVESSPLHIKEQYIGPGFVAPIGVGGHFPPEIPFTPQVDLFAIEHQSRDSRVHPGANGVKEHVIEDGKVKIGGDDFELTNRFNVDPTRIPDAFETARKDFDARPVDDLDEDFLNATAEFFKNFPESYGLVSGSSPNSQGRGIATLPGGVPLYKVVTDKSGQALQRLGKSPSFPDINLVGGIGVFFPGEDGFATHEQGFVAGVGQTEKQRNNATKVLESEYIALIAAAALENNRIDAIASVSAFSRDVDRFNEVLPKLEGFVVPNGRIDLVGITLELFGPTPDRSNRSPGIDQLIQIGDNVLPEIGVPILNPQLAASIAMPIDTSGEMYLAGQPVPERWLVAPTDATDGSGLTAADVERIIEQGIDSAEQTRAAIRLDIDHGFRPGPRTRMVLSVTDTNGTILGLYRMEDATIFSIDVSVAKARNTAYYADPGALQPQDQIDFNWDGEAKPSTGDSVPLGTALSNRTFRFLVEPRYPTGIELPGPRLPVSGLENDPAMDLCDQRPDLCLLTGPQSILRMPGIDPKTAENIDPENPLPVDVYRDPESLSVLAFDAFNPSRNFRDPGNVSPVADTNTDLLANQNGVVFFPGSAPLYNDGTRNLVGGFGVSGDGVDQDDVVTAAGQVGYEPDAAILVDQFLVADVRLPYQKFNRNPFGR